MRQKNRPLDVIKIEGHKNFYPTSCPGRYFPIDKIMAELENPTEEFEDAVKLLQSKGILASPDYWLENAVQGKTVNGEYAAILIKRAVAFLIKV
jgi:hypothetical protein